jgi:hypothetical protein
MNNKPYSKKKLFLFVEGVTDELFFEKAIKPALNNFYFVSLVSYANSTKEMTSKNFELCRQNNHEYLVIADINSKKCVTQKKQVLLKRFRKADTECIYIVVKEIEAWFIAGLSQDSCKKLRIDYTDNTDTLTKEDFDKMIPREFDSSIDFMSEILKHYSIETAIKKNSSFRRFHRRILLPLEKQ